MKSWFWNPITAWQASSYVTIFQMAWLKTLVPDTYEWVMACAEPCVRVVNGYASAAWDVLVEVINSS